MPKYRQLHTKVIDSQDVAEMPDDFTRFFYLMLVVILDSAGRGIDNPAWVRSHAFPLREDVTIEMVEQSMNWFAEHDLIRRYNVKGRKYFFCPSFLELQSGLEKETPSSLPEPPKELLRSNSGATPEQVKSDSSPMQCNAISNSNQSNSNQPPLITSVDQSAWNKALGRLQSVANKADFQSYVQNLELEEVNDNTFVACIANEYAAEFIRSRYVSTLEKDLSATTGRSCQIQIVT